MRLMVARTMSGTCTYVDVVISPATHARPVVTSVSQATRAVGSSARIASSTASEMASATLSGCPSVTDSDVKRWRSNKVVVGDWSDGRTFLEKSELGQRGAEAAMQLAARSFGGRGRERCRGCLLGHAHGNATDDALHQRYRSRRDAELPNAKSDQGEGHEGLRRHFAADRHFQPGALPHLNGALNELQHRRMQWREP